MRRTKIVCTLGPAVDSDEAIRQLIRNGMNVARFNFSHGDHEEHYGRVERVRRIAAEEGKNVALMLDNKGPEIRTGKFKTKPVELELDSVVYIRYEEILGDAKEFSCTYKHLHEDLRVGDRVMVDDGLVELEVLAIEDKDVKTVVRNAGPVSDYKSINLPNVSTNLPALTERDERDILFAVEHEMDFVAASFIRKAEDVESIKKLLADHDGNQIQIISKIENQEGVDNIEEIIAVSDGIMVARGDLGVEVPVEKVPGIQKYILARCLEEGKYSITATQMLDSMIRNPRPTRAEVSDVANAIIDGTGAIMLSGETANGKYSAQAVAVMRTIAEEIENDIVGNAIPAGALEDRIPNVATATSEAAVHVADDIGASVIICGTTSGRTPRSIARFRPHCPIIAVTYDKRALRQMALVWGVEGYYSEQVDKMEDFFTSGVELAKEEGFVNEGDLAVLVCGTPLGQSGSTNTMIVRHIDSSGFKGESLGSRIEVGEVFLLPDNRDIASLFLPENAVLVATDVTEEDLPIIRQAVALVLETSDIEGNRAVEVAKNLNLPVIYGAKDAKTRLFEGQIVCVDPKHKIVR